MGCYTTAILDTSACSPRRAIRLTRHDRSQRQGTADSVRGSYLWNRSIALKSGTTASVPVTPRRRAVMTPMQCVKRVGAATAIGVFVGVVISSGPVRAWDDDDLGDARVSQGFKIAPVPLNLARKNKALVGLGSYLVNAVSGCDDCHSMGPPTEFTRTGNPYLRIPPDGPFDGHTKINSDTYLGGGRDFGPFPGPSSPVHIVSRNLTPDKTGMPVGGRTFSEFRSIMKTGVDLDNLHPIIPSPPPPPPFPPFNGAVLQIMPWPIYQNMTDHDLRAIYEYLSAIPCIKGPAKPSPLHNDCR